MINPQANFLEKLLGLFFHLLPHHAISRLIYRLTHIKSPKAVPFIKWFIWQFKVDMYDAVRPEPSSYKSFNEFFTRPLNAEARPICEQPYLACPVDGTVSQAQGIANGDVFQAKGHFYSLQKLLGGDEALSKKFAQGNFSTIYLAPYNYHRIHIPCDAKLSHMIHIPGRIFSVAPWSINAVSDLFARNERVVCVFDTAYGAMAMILVGAINVAAIETVWAGLITPPAGRSITYCNYQTQNISFKKGEEIGRFNMGSTVILITQPSVKWLDHIKHGQIVKMGQALATPDNVA